MKEYQGGTLFKMFNFINSNSVGEDVCEKLVPILFFLPVQTSACLEPAAQRSKPSAATSVPVPQGEDAIVKIVDALIALCSRPTVWQGPENTSGHQISAVNLPFYLERQK